MKARVNQATASPQYTPSTDMTTSKTPKEKDRSNEGSCRIIYTRPSSVEVRHPRLVSRAFVESNERYGNSFVTKEIFIDVTTAYAIGWIVLSRDYFAWFLVRRWQPAFHRSSTLVTCFHHGSTLVACFYRGSTLVACFSFYRNANIMYDVFE